MVLSDGDVAVNKTNIISPLMVLKFQLGHTLHNLFILSSVKAHVLCVFFFFFLQIFFYCPGHVVVFCALVLELLQGSGILFLF